ncbi:transporter substrate-binding domain-containing protein [Alteromonas sp. 1_MG-2023]|uniref:substrate-binding periplasmic protein n=1 Tax=Alteromonas sp. 1_MG-2023 TaxID=3062669 RepID=UPI0026E3C771|nr:transporter substrate-binding domain-containing protein [Alteromonas sp. 1_MG-2023]MDO6567602.1 transporter substrate-binding domain-containing protein [Alteromonas sp. 1_MG-2023]
MKKYVVIKLILLCFSFSSYFGVAEQHERPLPLDTDTLLTTGGSYYPYVDKKAHDGGWSVSLVKAIFRHMDTPIYIDNLPWQRGYKWALEGKYKGTFPYVYTEERAKLFVYSRQINSIPVRIYTSKDMVVNSLSDITGARLCLPYGHSLSKEQSEFIEKYKIAVQRAVNAGGCIAQVSKGWGEIGFTNGYLQGDHNSELFNVLDEVNIIDIPVATIPLYYIVSRELEDAQAHIDEFNAALEFIERSGERLLIDDHYESITTNR